MSILTKTLKGTRLGPSQAHLNITAFPLLSEAREAPFYLTLGQALKAKTAHIEEISEQGSVPEILFENSDDAPVLLLDGQELIGAKQHRILNLTILVPARSTLAIPVSCVERGRWHWSRRDFAESEDIAFAKLRMQKARSVSANLRQAGSRRADQAEVWSSVSQKSFDLGTSSHTDAMRDSYEQRRDVLNGYVQAFPAIDEQVGVVFALNGEVTGVDLFDHPATFKVVLPRLVRSQALDALSKKSGVTPVTSDSTAVTFLNRIAKAKTKHYRAIGEGEDIRIESEDLVGGALEVSGQILHLCAFCERTMDEDSPTNSASRAQARRRTWDRAA